MIFNDRKLRTTLRARCVDSHPYYQRQNDIYIHALLNVVNSNDVECKIFDDTERHAAALWQLSFLLN